MVVAIKWLVDLQLLKKNNDFKNFINNKFLKGKQNLINTNKFFYDSKISPSALNENFNDINSLSPYGSEILNQDL